MFNFFWSPSAKIRTPALKQMVTRIPALKQKVTMFFSAGVQIATLTFSAGVKQIVTLAFSAGVSDLLDQSQGLKFMVEGCSFAIVPQ